MTDSTAADWWGTAVSRIEPNLIELRGIPVQELIGTIGFGSMIWFMLRGSRPSAEQAALFEAALVAGVDHGPHAPSIAVARMAATCGIGLNNAMASAVNTLGDSHGGAGEQCVELLDEVLAEEAGGVGVETAAERVIASRPRYLPGYGHRFHPVDPRRDPLLALVDAAVADGVVAGDHLRAGRAVETVLNRERS